MGSARYFASFESGSPYLSLTQGLSPFVKPAPAAVTGLSVEGLRLSATSRYKSFNSSNLTVSENHAWKGNKTSGQRLVCRRS